MITLFAIWVWIAIGFYVLYKKSPKLYGPLETIVYMAAWPWFLLRGDK